MKEVLFKTILARVALLLLSVILTSCATVSAPEYPEKWEQIEIVSEENFSLSGIYYNNGEVCNDEECLPARASDIFFAGNACQTQFIPNCEYIYLIKMRNGNIRISAFTKDNKMSDKIFWFRDEDFEIKDGSLLRTVNCEPDVFFVGSFYGDSNDYWAATKNMTLKINLNVDNHLVIHEIRSGMIFNAFAFPPAFPPAVLLPLIYPIKKEKWYRFKRAQDLGKPSTDAQTPEQPSSDLYGPGF